MFDLKNHVDLRILLLSQLFLLIFAYMKWPWSDDGRPSKNGSLESLTQGLSKAGININFANSLVESLKKEDNCDKLLKKFAKVTLVETSKFCEKESNSDSNSSLAVEIGAGLTWNEVYIKLDKLLDEKYPTGNYIYELVGNQYSSRSTNELVASTLSKNSNLQYSDLSRLYGSIENNLLAVKYYDMEKNDIEESFCVNLKNDDEKGQSSIPVSYTFMLQKVERTSTALKYIDLVFEIDDILKINSGQNETFIDVDNELIMDSPTINLNVMHPTDSTELATPPTVLTSKLSPAFKSSTKKFLKFLFKKLKSLDPRWTGSFSTTGLNFGFYGTIDEAYKTFYKDLKEFENFELSEEEKNFCFLKMGLGYESYLKFRVDRVKKSQSSSELTFSKVRSCKDLKVVVAKENFINRQQASGTGDNKILILDKTSLDDDLLISRILQKLEQYYHYRLQGSFTFDNKIVLDFN